MEGQVKFKPGPLNNGEEEKKTTTQNSFCPSGQIYAWRTTKDAFNTKLLTMEDP